MTRNTTPLAGTFRQRCAAAQSTSDYVDVLRSTRTWKDQDSDTIVRHFLRVRATDQRPNRMVTLKPSPGAVPLLRPDQSCEELRRLAATWIWRVGQVIYGHSARRRPIGEWFPFIGFLEIRDAQGAPTPPHYHVLLRLGPEGWAKFDGPRGGACLWHRLVGTEHPLDAVYHCGDGQTAAAATYCSKRASDSWALDYLVDPSRLRHLCGA